MTHERQDNYEGDRLLELLSEEASCGLGADERAELESLLSGHDELESGELDEAAAALAQVFATASFEPMPSNIRERCIGSARAIWSDDDTSDDAAPAVSSAPPPLKMNGEPVVVRSPSVWSSTGWVAAAACLLLAVMAWIANPGQVTSPSMKPWINVTDNQTMLASQRNEFVRSHASAVIWDWSKWGDEYAGVTGDVVWDPETNEGFMRFENLPPNDPQTSKYQLWIVDSARGTPLEVPPVDGGMFDVKPSEDGVWIVPFKARLPVGEAFGFGVTLEDDDGVVVSSQEVKTVIATAPAPSG